MNSEQLKVEGKCLCHLRTLITNYRTAQNDAQAHTRQAAKERFQQISKEDLSAALEHRDGHFGDSRAKVTGT